MKQKFDGNIVRNKLGTMNANSNDNPQTQFLMHIVRYRFHNKHGIRYYILIFCIISYALLGGIIFHAAEHHDEIHYLETNVDKLNMLIRRLTCRIFNATNITLTERKQNNVDELIKIYYQQMLETEEKYKQSILYKYNQMKNGAFTWTFGSAVFYAITLFTTIGYGTIACRTTIGKILTVIYSIIGIPLMLAILQDVGNTLLRYLTTIYELIPNIAKKMRLRHSKISDIEKDNIEYKDVEFPMKLFIPITAIYLIICTIIVLLFDQNHSMPSQMTFGDAFYFSFVFICYMYISFFVLSFFQNII
ncbi:unnamed protein product [Wuchereria bancrofti]|uniref:Potassium channel domain-containing protein n=2 Tax=Wuchereria bancrofti TaxID=6293 RepID=A0A3P7E9W7_WUCBA|nr:unnamed protein product [Wuchereria bancrofti]